MFRLWTFVVSLVVGATAGVVGYIAHSFSPFVAAQEIGWAVGGALLAALVWSLTADRADG